MVNQVPMINGQQHAFADIKIQTLGRVITGFTSINYDDNVDKQNNYGAGQYPNHRAQGNYTANCNITLYQFEIVALQQAAAGGRLQQIPPFDIVVEYQPKNGGAPVTDIIKNCEFKTNGRSLSQGDMMSQHDFELIISHINWGGQTVN